MLKQRLVFLLKHNAVLQKIYTGTMSLFFRCIGLFVPTDEQMVLFSSFMGLHVNDSPKKMFEYMKSHKEYAHLRCIWAVESPEKYPDLQTVRIDTPRYFLTALRAKYWVTNTNIERGLSFKKRNTVYLNTWHGVALKKIGNDCPGRKDYNFRSVDILCVSGEHDERVFQSAFRASPQKYLRCGMPRNDALWHADEQQRREVRKKLGIGEDKKAILYAPTWRESTDGGKSYAIRPPLDFTVWKQHFGEDCVILFRAHHITTKVLDLSFDSVIQCMHFND